MKDRNVSFVILMPWAMGYVSRFSPLSQQALTPPPGIGVRCGGTRKSSKDPTRERAADVQIFFFFFFFKSFAYFGWPQECSLSFFFFHVSDWREKKINMCVKHQSGHEPHICCVSLPANQATKRQSSATRKKDHEMRGPGRLGLCEGRTADIHHTMVPGQRDKLFFFSFLLVRSGKKKKKAASAQTSRRGNVVIWLGAHIKHPVRGHL